MPKVAKATSSYKTDLPPSDPFTLEEVVQGGPDLVVVPADASIKDILQDEKFMNERLEIRCLETNDPSAQPTVQITVMTGGITGPMKRDKEGHLKPGVPGPGGQKKTYIFERGRKYIVPRFVYEALAHSKQTETRQRPHPTMPMEMLQTQHHTFSYQFECLRDSNPSPKAIAWREKMLSDPA